MKVDVFSRFLEPDGRTVGQQQCAIASRLKAHSSWFEEFKPTENLPNLRSGFAFAALKYPDGGLMMLYSLHNSWEAMPKEDRLTWRINPRDTRFDPTTFDYILTSGLKEPQANMYPGVSIETSDHAPIGILLERK